MQIKTTSFLSFFLGVCVFLVLFLSLLGFGMQYQQNIQPPGSCGTIPPPQTRYTAQDSVLILGEGLFKNECASCHNKNMKDHLTGPALEDTEKNWAAYPRADLYQFIRGSQEMIKEGHPRAVELWEGWQPVIMNDFPGLSDTDIEAILAYIEVISGRYSMTIY